jgi:2,4-diketo-3-deoxy-L-fuconate hydrolase
MKLCRYGPAGEERPGVVDADGRLRSLYPLVSDFTADMLTPEGLQMLQAIDVKKLPLVAGEPRLGAPVAGIREIYAIGLNYRDHAAEGGVAVPEYPAVFNKSITSLSGCADPIRMPEWSKQLDWEVELAFFIGKAARGVSAKDALAHVAGYSTVIDVTERSLQIGPGGQMGHGKSLDSFTPVGPWFVTADEIGNPQELKLWLEVNGVRHQNGTTREMVFPVATIVAHLSKYQTLQPGDLVITGTPAGIGYGMKPQLFLRPSDRVVAGVTGLGEQSHTVVQSA